MKKAYSEAGEFLRKKPVVIFMIFFMAFVLSPLKSNMFTFMIPFFIQCFFITGILGVAKDYKEMNNIGFKAVFVNAGQRFTFVVINLFWVLIIFLIDFIVVLFFNILPMIIVRVNPSEHYGGVILFLIFLLVFLYRAPLLLGAFFAPVAVEKESGKYAITKVKEILWANPRYWFNILGMLVIYAIIFFAKVYVQNNVLSDTTTSAVRIIFFTGFDIAGEMFLAYTMIVNFFFYKRKVEENKDLQEVFNQYNYKGKIKGIMGTFIM